jgi:hypothetical protein
MSKDVLEVMTMYWAPISFIVWAVVQSILTVTTVRRHDKRLSDQWERLDNYERRISRLEGRLGISNGR